MPNTLNGVLAQIPGLAGYEAGRLNNQNTDMANMGILAKLQATATQNQELQMKNKVSQREEAMRAAIAALPPEKRTRENIVPILLEFGSAKEAVPLMTNENTVNSQKAMGLARLGQAKAISDRNYEVALRNAKSNEERNRISAEKAISDQQFDAEKVFWETGQRVNVQPIGLPSTAQAQPAPTAAPAAPTPVPAQPAPIQPTAVPSAMPPKARAAVNQANAVNTGEAVIRGLRENFDRLKDAPQQLANIEKAKALIPEARVFQGPLGEQKLWAVKFFKSNLGMDMNLEGVTSAEELRSRIFFNIMDNLKKLDAQPSQLQQQIMQQSLGTLGTDPDALVKVLDAFGQAIRDKVGVYQSQVDEAKKGGINWPHSISIKKQGTPTIKTDAEFDALPSGTEFVGPDGKKRKKP